MMCCMCSPVSDVGTRVCLTGPLCFAGSLHVACSVLEPFYTFKRQTCGYKALYELCNAAARICRRLLLSPLFSDRQRIISQLRPNIKIGVNCRSDLPVDKDPNKGPVPAGSSVHTSTSLHTFSVCATRCRLT
jgi:hypothetical protein